MERVLETIVSSLRIKRAHIPLSNPSSERIYSKEHVWLLTQVHDEYLLGISEYAQQQLGDIVFVELPTPGDVTHAGEACAVVESVKSASDIICPVSGDVLVVNEQLTDEPELINESPLERGWILRIKANSQADMQTLLTAQGYHEFLASS